MWVWREQECLLLWAVPNCLPCPCQLRLAACFGEHLVILCLLDLCRSPLGDKLRARSPKSCTLVWTNLG